MEDFIKSKFIDITVKIFCFLFKFIVIYYILGMISILIVFLNLELIGCLVYGTNWNFGAELENFDPYNLISNVKFLIINKIPLADILDGIFQPFSIEGFSDAWNAVSRANQNISLSAFLSGLLPNMAQISLASLLFFVFSRFNRLFVIFGEKEYNVALFFVSILWTTASLSITITIMEAIKIKVAPFLLPFVYVIILVGSFLIHTILLKKGSSFKTWLVWAYLILDLVFCAFNGFWVWAFGNFTLIRDFSLYTVFNFYGITAALCMNKHIEESLLKSMLRFSNWLSFKDNHVESLQT